MRIVKLPIGECRAGAHESRNGHMHIVWSCCCIFQADAIALSGNWPVPCTPPTEYERIALEQREAERRKRDFQEIERAVAAAKQKFKQETTEVMLGERDQVSAEVAAAQMLGYRNELIRQQRGRGGQGSAGAAGPRVREPEGGLAKDRVKDREMYRKRQAAGGGVTAENIAVQ